MYDGDWGVVWAIEKSASYTYSAAAAALCRCCCCSSFYVDTVCGFTTNYLDLIDYNYQVRYTVRCCTTYEYVFVYTCHVLLLLLDCVLLCCCCLLLLFVHGVPECRIVAVVHCVWFRCVPSLHSNTMYFRCTPFCQYCRTYSVDFLPIIMFFCQKQVYLVTLVQKKVHYKTKYKSHARSPAIGQRHIVPVFGLKRSGTPGFIYFV